MGRAHFSQREPNGREKEQTEPAKRPHLGEPRGPRAADLNHGEAFRSESLSKLSISGGVEM